MTMLTSIADLEDYYGTPFESATIKEIDHLTPSYRALVEASPFVALATTGPEGLDCSPRGDAGSVVRVADERTLHLPDRRGNDRIGLAPHIVRDPRVALLFLLPGCDTTLRVNGKAGISVDPILLGSFAVAGKEPRSVVVITIDAVYFQCARAIVRSRLWNPEHHVDPGNLPSPGRILSELSQGQIGGEAYDIAWPERASQTMW